jgi:hypothetical protein
MVDQEAERDSVPSECQFVSELRWALIIPLSLSQTTYGCVISPLDPGFLHVF